eukprot:scaffold90210_cov105-Phaeocystis_antarctica.AAC.1
MTQTESRWFAPCTLSARLYEARSKRLAKRAMPSPYGWLERHTKAELEWRDACIKRAVTETLVQELKTDAKDTSRSFWSARTCACAA